MKGDCGECNRRWFCDIDPKECDEWPDPVPKTAEGLCIMKCKFEHDGGCCNCGSPQYMEEYKPLICKCAVPTYNTFAIIDRQTGAYPDLQKIALTEDWAKGLIHCDMEGFAVGEDGTLFLLDECGNYAVVPYGRFEITYKEV